MENFGTHLDGFIKTFCDIICDSNGYVFEEKYVTVPYGEEAETYLQEYRNRASTYGYTFYYRISSLVESVSTTYILNDIVLMYDYGENDSSGATQLILGDPENNLSEFAKMDIKYTADIDPVTKKEIPGTERYYQLYSRHYKLVLEKITYMYSKRETIKSSLNLLFDDSKVEKPNSINYLSINGSSTSTESIKKLFVNYDGTVEFLDFTDLWYARGNLYDMVPKAIKGDYVKAKKIYITKILEECKNYNRQLSENMSSYNYFKKTTDNLFYYIQEIPDLFEISNIVNEIKSVQNVYGNYILFGKSFIESMNMTAINDNSILYDTYTRIYEQEGFSLLTTSEMNASFQLVQDAIDVRDASQYADQDKYNAYLLKIYDCMAYEKVLPVYWVTYGDDASKEYHYFTVYSLVNFISDDCFEWNDETLTVNLTQGNGYLKIYDSKKRYYEFTLDADLTEEYGTECYLLEDYPTKGKKAIIKKLIIGDTFYNSCNLILTIVKHIREKNGF